MSKQTLTIEQMRHLSELCWCLENKYIETNKTNDV